MPEARFVPPSGLSAAPAVPFSPHLPPVCFVLSFPFSYGLYGRLRWGNHSLLQEPPKKAIKIGWDLYEWICWMEFSCQGSVAPYFYTL
jgi:hypothetical protein